MIVSIEISYYPLLSDFINPVNLFIDKVSQDGIKVEIGKMSSVLTGEYAVIMKIITETMGDLMKTYPSVFTLKISNTCEI